MIEELRDYDWGTTKQLAIKSKELKELEEKYEIIKSDQPVGTTEGRSSKGYA